MKLGDQELIRWASTEDPVEVVKNLSQPLQKVVLKKRTDPEPETIR